MRAAALPVALALALASVGCTATTPGGPDGGASPGGPRASDPASPGGGGTREPGNGGNGDGAGSGGGGNGEPSGRDDQGDHGPAGSFGERFLSPDIGRASIEIDSSGPVMTQRAREALRTALQEHGGKTVRLAPSGSAPMQAVYTENDLHRIARATRDVRSAEGTAALHVLVLDGRFEEPDVLGVAFEAATFAIFPSRIRGGLLSSVNYAAFEEAVAVHELGHLFGLVNLTGQGAFHEDPDHPFHSRNQGSVMYWAVEDVSIGNVFRGGPPTTFDADDRAEMAAIRE